MNIDPRSEFLYKDLESKLPPPVPSGPEPISGLKARAGAGNVTGRILATFAGPRQQAVRSIGDEFALLVAQYNDKFKKKLPIDPYDPYWTSQGSEIWLLQNMFGRIATGRVNSYLCAAGNKGHCPKPSIISEIGSAISKIPVLGPVLKAAASPITMVSNLAQGERIDHALLGAMKEQLGAIKSVAPYVAAVASFVPGIGTGVAAALAAGAALAEGKNITQALEEGIKGAIPGGSIAAAGFDLAKKVASGANVAKAALETARATLPPAAQKAFDIGVAVTKGKQLQNDINSAVANLTKDEKKQLLDVGAKAVQTTPGLTDLAKSLPSDTARQGLQFAAGALAHQGVNEAQIRAMRSKLTGDALHGFDETIKSQVVHYPWLQNVLDEQALAALTPEQQKQLVDYAAAKATPAAPRAPAPTPKPPTPKPHEPPAPTRALATTVAPTSAVPAPAAPTTPAATPLPVATAPTDRPYPPYPPMPGAVHGLGYAPYPSFLGVPPPHPHPHVAHEHHPTHHGGRAAYAPATVVIATPAGGTCRQWSEPIEMDQAMIWAARSAVNGSRGQPRMVQGPDGTNYLFAIENGVLTARACIA